MLFTDRPFFLLVAVTFALFYLPPLRRAQTPILILASLAFYLINCIAIGQTYYLLLLLGSIAINGTASHRAFFSATLPRARAWATAGVIANLLLLGFFKYARLIGNSLPEGWTGADEPLHWLVAITLPVGISFFTFEGITLVVDAFKARDEQTFFGTPRTARRHHLLSTMLFVSFFPHLVAGPILKAHDFFPQIRPKALLDVDWLFAFRKLTIGYFLKMVVADNLKDHTFWIQDPFFRALAGVDLIALLVGYSMQIFADFAGYSLIAVGLGALFGYRLPENFDFPYISRSFAEFWRRWHISLSSWLREYLYIPLGGNRKGPVRTYVNLFIVMFLGGLWHGAAWSYAVWGSVHGLALAIERFGSMRVSLPDNAVVRAGRMLGVFAIVTMAWLLFKLPNFGEVVAYVRTIGANWHRPADFHTLYYVTIFSLPVVLYHAAYLLKPSGVPGKVEWPRPLLFTRPLAYGTMLFLIAVSGGSSEEFIYFQF